MLVGHGADVAPGLGAPVEGGQRRAAPAPFPHLPVDPGSVREQAPQSSRRAAQFTGVAGFQMNLINIIAAIIGAGSSNAIRTFGRLWRKRHRLDPYALDRMDFEFEDRFRDLMKLKPSEYCGANAGRPSSSTDRPEIDRRDGGRDPDVGVGLPHLMVCGRNPRSTSRSSSPASRRNDPQNHLREPGKFTD